jgi:hypothetical protein
VDNRAEKIARSFVFCLLFLSFPLALLNPFGFNRNIFYFELSIINFITLPLLLVVRKANFDIGLLKVGLLISSLQVLSCLVNDTSLLATVTSVSSVGVLLLGNILLSGKNHRTQLLNSLSALWLFNLLCIYLSLGSFQYQGVMGNINWSSALTLSLLPCVLHVLWSHTKNRYLVTGIGFCLVSVSVDVLLKTQCRASIFTLLVLLISLLFLFLHKKYYKFLYLFVGIGVAVGAITYFGASNENIRIEIWKSTIALIADNGLLGVGAENFDRVFQNYVTPSQKSMLISSHTTMHPHNEILYIASLYGVVVVGLWLWLIGKSLFSKSATPQLIILKLCLISLLTHGMFDKTLFVQPTGIIFLLLIGLLYPSMKEKRELAINRLTRYGLAALGLLFLWVGISRSTSSWHYRQGVELKRVGKNKEAYNAFQRSLDFDYDNTKSHYQALVVSMQNSGKQNPSKFHIDYLDGNHPYAGSFQLIKADYFERLAFADRANQEAHLKVSFEALNVACTHNVSDIASYLKKQEFSFKYLPYEKSISLHKSLIGLYENKFSRIMTIRQWSQGELLKKWLRGKTYGELLREVVKILGPLKYSTEKSYLYPRKFKSLLPALKGKYNFADMKFAADSFKNYKDLGNLGAIELVEKIFSEVKLVDSGFNWPRKVWLERQGSQLSRLCLMAQLLGYKNYRPLLLKQENGAYHLCYFVDQQVYLVAEGQVIKLDSLNSILPKYTGFYYFNYPQAFFYKNELMSSCFSQHDEIPDFCKTPGMNFKYFQKYLGKNKVKVLEEPFELLQQELLK